MCDALHCTRMPCPKRSNTQCAALSVLRRVTCPGGAVRSRRYSQSLDVSVQRHPYRGFSAAALTLLQFRPCTV